MSTTLTLSQGDLEFLAQGLEILADLRVSLGLEVGSFVYDDLEFVLDWKDEGGYTLDTVS